MKVLLLGTRGREAAIAWKLAQSPRLTQLYVNHPTVSFPKTCLMKIDENNSQQIIQAVQENQIDLVVIASEEPLAAGLADVLQKQNIAVFGPNQAAAQIEASKTFAKDFMLRHKIPTARYAKFKAFPDAQLYIQSIDYPIVIKASGLAGGKGVFLPETSQEAIATLKNLLQDQILGAAGSEIIIEERLEGEEVSLLAFTDGTTVQPMPLARDHKRLLNGDQGPNTGGMGAIAPVPLKEFTLENLTHTILDPTIQGLRSENKNFVGVIYAGLMLTNTGPKVLEFNCRFGDPETQVLLPLLDSDLLEIMLNCTQQKLKDYKIKWKNAAAACVVLAAEEYPNRCKTGHVISGLDKNLQDTLVFHAGTALQNQQLVSNGGRVLTVTGISNDLTSALHLAYQRVHMINFNGMQFRKDIGASQKDLYAAAGVNITAGNKTIELMTQAVKSTYGPEVLAGIGAFGGMYDASAVKNMQKPVLVASTDGIGTKVHLAAQCNSYHSLGFDIVNHSVNDILVQGAKPLFFLDYLAASKLDPEKMAMIVTGMAEACRAVNCALLGGETAEMPGVYQPNTFDVAGTIVGIVEKDQALPRKNLKSGDVLVGIASSGPHTNGYSLIRKIFENHDLHKNLPELNSTLGDALLKPHRNYLPLLQPVLSHPEKPIKALVHITGGGFFENIPRVLSADLGAKINLESWPVPPLFQLIQKQGHVPNDQMYRVFNMGIGMIMIIDPIHVELVNSLFKEKIWQIGQLIAGDKTVCLK